MPKSRETPVYIYILQNDTRTLQCQTCLITVKNPSHPARGLFILRTAIAVPLMGNADELKLCIMDLQ